MSASSFARHRALLLIGSTACSICLPAVAQTTPAEDDAQSEIVVTGSFARSLDDAIGLKRNASSISDIISASDIGDFPSVNVAEALQRIPGVTISREAGEGQFVSVRGLGPNFQAVTLSGVPIAYNENIRNSDQSGRQFQFRVIPADLISGIVVTKGFTADLIDGGIGSNIDIRIARPLETKPFLTARAFQHWEQRTGDVTPNGSLSGSWRNADETFGIIGGVSVQMRKVQFDRFQHFGYTNRTIGTQTVSVPNDVVITLEQENRRRISAMAGLEWQPVPALTLGIEALYSNFNNKIEEDRISFEWGGRADFSQRLTPSSAIIREGVLYGGEIQGGRVQRNAEYSEQTHKNYFVKAIARYDAGGWQVTPSVSYSRAESGLDLPLQRIDGQTANNPAGQVYSYAYGDDPVGNTQIARVQTNVALSGPAAAPFFRYRIRPTNSLDTDLTARFDVLRELDFGDDAFRLSELRAGFQYSDRSRNYQRRDRQLTARPGVTVGSAFTRRLLPENVFNQTVNDFFGSWLSYDPAAFAASFVVAGEFDGVAPQSRDLVATGQDRQQSYGVGEEIYAGYGRLDFEGELGAVGLKGNLGVRYVKTSTVVDGTILRAGAGAGGVVTTIIEPAQFKGSYDEWLPTINLNFELTRRLVLRLSASRSLTRPSLSDLRTATVPNSSVIADVFDRGQIALDERPASALNGVGGNPTLQPYTSVNFDASLEYYFKGFGALSVAGFRKNISNFIGAIGRTETVVLNTRAGGTVTGDFLITRPQNIGDATITGVEFGAAIDLAFGFGIAASATLVESEGKIQTPTGIVDVGLQGVSDRSYSISPFFRQGPFEINFSYTWRSGFATNGNISPGSNAVTNPLETIFADSFGTLDFGAKFVVTPKFELFAEGTNILATRQAAYLGTTRRPYQIHEYGRSFNFGVRLIF